MEIEVTLPAPHPRQREFVECQSKRIMVRAGRRGGKTYGLAIRACREFLTHRRRVLYAAPTSEQTEAFWSLVSRWLQPLVATKAVRISNHERFVEFPGTENRLKAKTAWNEDSMRGDYADFLILDEYQLMGESVWDEVAAPMLLDNGGTAVFIFTPPSVRSRTISRAKDKLHASKFYRENAKKDRWKLFHFSSLENPHLDRDALAEIAEDMSRLAYVQEILAEDVEEIPGALWNFEMLDKNRVAEAPEMGLVVVGVDVQTKKGSGGETGIVVAGRSLDGHNYILADKSLDASPAEWARQIVRTYHEYDADFVVVEKNQGGDMIKEVLRTHDQEVWAVTKEVWASRGKYTRAEPIATKSENGLIHHVGTFPDLESQMVSWIPGETSPDRLDALVWACSYLKAGRVTIFA